MTGQDTPWGAQETILNTAISMGGESQSLLLRKLQIENEEMTPVARHKSGNVIIYVEDGAIDLQVGEDFYELEDGDGHYIEAGEKHQIENLDATVTTVMQIIIPFDPDDMEIIEDPYA